MEDPLPAWKPTLDAITGARHGGQTEGILDQLQDLADAHPAVAEVAFQLAWTLESLGRETEAIPHYEKAISLGLPPNEQSGALIGLAACLLATDQTNQAASALESGQRQFPEQPEFAVYLAIVRHAQGRSAEALQLAMETLLDTSEDPGITAYQRDLRHLVSRIA